MKKCNVISIANQKGGVGKTTTTVHLGIGLVKQGKKVFLIDADPQASLTLALGVKQPDELDYTITNVMTKIMEDEPYLPSEGILDHSEGISFLPANIELSGLEIRMMNAISRENILKTYIDEKKSQYDYILIDCSPSLNMLTINAFAASNSVIIPTQPHYLSAKGLILLLKSVARIRKQINPSLNISGILMTMVDRRTNFSKDMISLLRGQYGTHVNFFSFEIPHSIKVVEASASGQSIYTYDKHNKVAAAYTDFTKEVLTLEKQRNKNRADSIR